jgi:hypothetical protein
MVCDYQVFMWIEAPSIQMSTCVSLFRLAGFLRRRHLSLIGPPDLLRPFNSVMNTTVMSKSLYIEALLTLPSQRTHLHFIEIPLIIRVGSRHSHLSRPLSLFMQLHKRKVWHPRWRRLVRDRSLDLTSPLPHSSALRCTTH